MREIHGEIVTSAFPGGIFGPRNLTLPLKHIRSAVWIVDRLGHKTERMIAAPFLTLFLESVDDQLIHFLLLHF